MNHLLIQRIRKKWEPDHAVLTVADGNDTVLRAAVYLNGPMDNLHQKTY